MPVFPKDGRLDELRRLGLSEPLLRLSAGELVHSAFDPRFLGPPVRSYGSGEPSVPEGPTLVPLWDFADGVQGVRETAGGLEFVDFDVEAPEECEVVARTEQGFLAWMFAELNADLWGEPEFDDLPAAARAVGYRHYDAWLAVVEVAGREILDDPRERLPAFIDRIDSGKRP